MGLESWSLNALHQFFAGFTADHLSCHCLTALIFLSLRDWWVVLAQMLEAKHLHPKAYICIALATFFFI